MQTALELVTEERQRQISQEGYSVEHDDRHAGGQIAQAAACYTEHAALQSGVLDSTGGRVDHKGEIPPNWPWHKSYWKPRDRIRNLVKACALNIAEIERLQRLEQKEARDLEDIRLLHATKRR